MHQISYAATFHNKRWRGGLIKTRTSVRLDKWINHYKYMKSTKGQRKQVPFKMSFKKCTLIYFSEPLQVEGMFSQTPVPGMTPNEHGSPHSKQIFHLQETHSSWLMIFSMACFKNHQHTSTLTFVCLNCL